MECLKIELPRCNNIEGGGRFGDGRYGDSEVNSNGEGELIRPSGHQSGRYGGVLTLNRVERGRFGIMSLRQS